MSPFFGLRFSVVAVVVVVSSSDDDDSGRNDVDDFVIGLVDDIPEIPKASVFVSVIVAIKSREDIVTHEEGEVTNKELNLILVK
mmetsp:Transcript_13191/g.18175  ORF Transcript_13191/g.18175 Transcript_13191/m.18175 type:complete len:84 (-) Transcript_13191:157-408(-)